MLFLKSYWSTTTDQCEAKREDGEICAIDEECLLLRCNSGICKSLTVTMDSKILTPPEQSSLLLLIGMESVIFRLAYRASKDGFRGYDFHRRSDGKLKTLSIIKETGGFVFGGYTSTAWSERVNTYTYDTKAFLYTFKNPNNSPMKLELKRADGYQAMHSYSSYGPTYGGHDLHVADNSNGNTNSHLNLGVNYYGPNGLTSTNAGVFLKGGSNYHFQTTEVELFTAYEFESRVIDITQQQNFLSLLGMTHRVLVRLYDASRDGFKASDFHQRLDGYANTLTVIQESNGYIFGGYTNKKWEGTGSNQYIVDEKAFLFSFTNPQGVQKKLRIKAGGGDAICNNVNYGPTFGGHDIYVSSDSDTSGSSYMNSGRSYAAPDEQMDTNGAIWMKGGSDNTFTVASLEVYAISDFVSDIIVGEENIMKFLHLTGFEQKSHHFSLLYRATRDGFRGSDFHSKVSFINFYKWILKGIIKF